MCLHLALRIFLFVEVVAITEIIIVVRVMIVMLNMTIILHTDRFMLMITKSLIVFHVRTHSMIDTITTTLIWSVFTIAGYLCDLYCCVACNYFYAFRSKINFTTESIYFICTFEKYVLHRCIRQQCIYRAAGSSACGVPDQRQRKDMAVPVRSSYW